MRKPASRRRWVGLALVVCLLAAIPALGQGRNTSALTGRVTAEDGSVLPGATVEIESPSLLGGVRTAIANDDGRYRFPEISPGVYTITASLDGFQTVRREGVVLALGKTIDVPMSLSLQKLEETLVVVAEAATIDTVSSATSTNLPDAYLQNLPTGRFQPDVLNLAPAINNDSAYGGGGSSANSYQLDGVDVSDPDGGTPWAFVNFNIIEETELVGLGAPAEYGSFTGVVFNSITKSGGNDVKGNFQAYYTNDSLTESNSDNPDLQSGTEEFYDASLQLGGPFLKDKLWYFLSAQYLADDSTSGGPIRTERDPRAFGKLSFQASERTASDLWVEWDQFDITGRGGDLSTPLDATVTEDAPEVVWNLSTRTVLSPETILSLAYGGFTGYFYLDPASGYDTPGRIDAATGLASDNSTFFFLADRDRNQLNTSISHHAADFLKGDHDFKFGLEIERSTVRNRYGYPTGVWFYDNYGYEDDPGTEAYDPTYYSLAYQGGGYDINSTNERLSAFAQDTWRIGSRVTINPGVRIDLNRGKVTGGEVFSTNPIAPRLGIAWDVQGNGRSTFKAHYGRYYEAIFGAYFYQVDPNAFGTLDLLRVFPSGFRDSAGSSPPTRYAIDDDLKQPYVDQFLIGYDRELWPGIALSASAVYRENGDFLESVSRDGVFVPIQGFVATRDPETGDARSTGQAVTLFNYLNSDDDTLIITNPSGLERKYEGLILSVTRRMKNNWQLFASYVYSKAEGNVDNVSFSSSGGGNAGPSSYLDTPNSLVNSFGRLTNDNTHQVKIQGTYAIPKWNLSLSGNYTYLTGNTFTRRVNCFVLNQSDTDCFNDFEQNLGRYFGERRGSNRLPARNEIDLRAEWGPKIGGGKIGIILDVFNVTNQGRATDVETRDISSFGEATEQSAPRQYRIGFRYTF